MEPDDAGVMLMIGWASDASDDYGILWTETPCTALADAGFVDEPIAANDAR